MIKCIMIVLIIFVLGFFIYDWYNNDPLIQVSNYSNVLRKPIKCGEYNITEMYYIKDEVIIIFDNKNKKRFYSIIIDNYLIDDYKTKYGYKNLDNELIKIIINDYLDTLD